MVPSAKECYRRSLYSASLGSRQSAILYSQSSSCAVHEYEPPARVRPPRLAFAHGCAYARKRKHYARVRHITKGATSMFNPALCGLTERSRTGAGCSGASWNDTVATTARDGAARAWSGPRGATSPTSTSATSRRAASRSQASGKPTPSAGRWGYRLRSGRAWKNAGRTGHARRGGIAGGR